MSDRSQQAARGVASDEPTEGVLVGIDASGTVFGWALSALHPEEACEVEVHVDGSLLATVTADQFHPELDQLGARGGHCAFVFQLPASLLDGRPHVVSVRSAETGHPLDASPQTFSGRTFGRKTSDFRYAYAKGSEPGRLRGRRAQRYQRTFRKLRKLRQAPLDFFQDSRHAPLRALGSAVERFVQLATTRRASFGTTFGQGRIREHTSGMMKMSRSNTFQRKLAKFRRAPGRFLIDSPNSALRALGAMVNELQSPSPRRRRSSWKVPNAREIIEASGLFDAEYYLERYGDVRKSGLDPLDHYVRKGAAERRNPNWLFDPNFYAREAGIEATDDPLLHYILIGEREGIPTHRRFNPATYRAQYADVSKSSMGALQHFLKIGRAEGRIGVLAPVANPNVLEVDVDLRELAITVLIPVYNGLTHVRNCIESVLTHTNLPNVQLLLIDDASSDPATSAMLVEYTKVRNVTLLKNEVNLGFTRTVNRGLQHAAGRDVVLLNSDTMVSPRWLEYLAMAAYGAPSIATATALSDSAGAFSTPKSGPNNTLESHPLQEVARLSARAAPCDVHFVPTGNGFCMYMRREAIDKTGLLDDVNFPRGYGEENDWCMRAGKLGYRHVIALRAYVHHVNAVSFGSEAKERLRKDARAVLDRLHPDYGAQITRAFSSNTPLGAHRDALKLALEARRDPDNPPRPRVLFVVSTRTGGTPQTNEDLMRGLSHVCDPLLLISDHAEMQLYEYKRGRTHELAWHSLSEKITFMPHTSSEYDAVVTRWLSTYDIELVHIRHIAWHGLGLVSAAKRLNIPVVFSLHDFYTVCPSVNLTNGKDLWNETGVTVPHIVSPLWAGRDAKGVEAVQNSDPVAFLELWKSTMSAMLSNCDAFVTTSPFAKGVLSRNLPTLAERSDDFHVVPHGRDFSFFLSPGRAPKPNEPLRVLVAGNIGEAKGLYTILDLIGLDTMGEIDVHLIGTARSALLDSPRVHNHGAYARDDFYKLVAKIKPHVSLILSIWPETFCHTLTESWAAGLPVIGSDLGAVGERIRSSGIGWAVDPLDAHAIFALLKRIRSGEENWSEQTEALTRWRQTTADWDVAAMASEYFDIYKKCLARHRTFVPVEGRRTLALKKRVAVVVRGHFPHAMATAHVRIATPLRQASGEVDYEWLDGGEVIRRGVENYDGVIVCRNAGSYRVMSELARQCEKRGVPLALDVDDDLFNPPANKDRMNVYRAFAPALRELLAVAKVTTVSTAPLAELYEPLARQVRVATNRLDPTLWLGADPEPLPPPLELLPTDGIRLLYMGSATHGDDLELVLRAFERLREKHRVTLYVMGVTNTLPPNVIKIIPAETRYDLFVGWFRAVAHHFHIALAPLEDTDFNRKKSSLKFMDYAAVGLPVIASRVGPYAELIHSGVDGLLVDNTDEAWYAALESMIESAELRARLAKAAKVRATEEFACDRCVFDTVGWGIDTTPAADRTIPLESLAASEE